MGHDIENNLGAYAVMFLYVLLSAGPAWPIWSYTAIKFVHHVIYYTGRSSRDEQEKAKI